MREIVLRMRGAPYRIVLHVFVFFEAGVLCLVPTLAESDLASPYKRLFRPTKRRTPLYAVCKLLQPVGSPPLDNHGLLCAMLDAVERTRQDQFPGDERVETRSFLRHNGKI